MHVPYPVLQIKIAPLFFVAGLILSSCETGVVSLPSKNAIAVRQDLLATFTVEIPIVLREGTQMAVEWVNPISVHDLNPERLAMIAVDDLHFTVDVPVKKGAFLQYRYVQIGNKTAIETGTDGKPVVSRFYSISNHARIKDKALGFDSSTSNVLTGWIEGIITIQGGRQPASDVLISIAGVTGVSAVDGSFQIKNIPVGTHNLTIFSPNGLFQPIQQQATIEENNVTPIDLELVSRKLVNVTFLINTPINTPSNGVIRLFGSLASIGNSYAGLFGGTNPVQTKAPILTRQSESEFILVMSLPAETDIKYLYSLGDSFWNKETDKGGNSFIRTYFVPRQDAIVEDQIISWGTPNLEPVTFQFTPPKDTDANDVIQIQFNTFGWMDPIKMWPVRNGVYEFKLFSPLNFSESINYRFCRSLFCGTVLEIANSESIGAFQASTKAQILSTTNTRWIHLTKPSESTVVSTELSDPKSNSYLTSIELTDSFRPDWMPYYLAALDEIKALNANSVILPYSWTLQSADPVWLAPNLAHNPSVADIKQIASAAQERGLKVYLKPTIQFPDSADDFWSTFGKANEEWDIWFESVSNFYQKTALLAQQINADGIILGDEQTSQIIAESETITPLAGNYRSDSMGKWNQIFVKVKEISTLPLYLAIRFDDLQNSQVANFAGIDGIYLLDLGKNPENQQDARFYAEFVGNNLDEHIQPFLGEPNLKVWLGLDFPSVSYSQNGCITYPTQCNSPGIFNFPAPEQPEILISLQEQTNSYNAALPEINRRDWISGVSSRRFLVPGSYQDQSSSIRGKPAADVIWYWYAQMSGNHPQ